ncbi:polysaccharide pyruvyl transferase [Rhodobacteraceae bacterium (ex Bugula neritina AB1)]|nr:polysaccharide pyruvyl transferase [Rhodobacteraceae bacterium (ex Bugula neritina AB1)]
MRICLIMHSTRSDNLGVGALSVAEVAIVRDAAKALGRDVEITVMDWKDKRESYLVGDDITIRDLDGKVMLNPRGFFAIARRSDAVIDIGAGDSFADIYGSRRLKRMFILKYLTHIARTPLIMAPQTVGPFTEGWSKRLARWSMRLCAVVATRDAMSTKAAAELGQKDVIEASDVALRLPYDPPAPRTGGPVKVGINVSGLLMGGGYTGKNEFGLQMDYPGLIRDLIRHFQAHGDGCEVHLVPHVIVNEGPMVGEDDYRASAALATEFPGTVLAPSFASPSEAKTYIADMDFFMGARMHACIAAFSSGVPVIPMAYSRKFAGLFGTIGYARTVDCTSEESAAILDKITAAYEERAALKVEADAAFAQGREKLRRYEDALRDVLATL